MYTCRPVHEKYLITVKKSPLNARLIWGGRTLDGSFYWLESEYMEPLGDVEVATVLATAGIEFISRIPGEVQTPLQPNRTAASSRLEDGRFDGSVEEIVNVDDPDFVRKVNAAWMRMAVDYGLFNQYREFLIKVDYSRSSSEANYSWVCVRLQDDWDIAGSRVELFRSSLASFMTDRYVPEFSALSVDYRVLAELTVWGDGTVSTIVIRPDF